MTKKRAMERRLDCCIPKLNKDQRVQIATRGEKGQ